MVPHLVQPRKKSQSQSLALSKWGVKEVVYHVLVHAVKQEVKIVA